MGTTTTTTAKPQHHPYVQAIAAYAAAGKAGKGTALTPPQWAAAACGQANRKRAGMQLRNALRASGQRVQAGSNGPLLQGTTGTWPPLTAAALLAQLGYVVQARTAAMAGNTQAAQAAQGKQVAGLRKAAAAQRKGAAQGKAQAQAAQAPTAPVQRA